MKKYTINIQGHSTSISLEEVFWEKLKEIAAIKKMSVTSIIAHIDESRPAKSNLSSNIRVFILNEMEKKQRYRTI